MKERTRKVCVTGLGIALFAGLSLCLQVPVFDNYYLCLGYAVMAVWSCLFGTFSGMAVGSLGVVIYCLLISGLRGMPGWAAGNLVIGAMIGPAYALSRRLPSKWGLALNVAAAVAASAAGILGVKSAVEWMLYSQPFAVRAAKNLTGFVADAAMLALSAPLGPILAAPARKVFPSMNV